SDFIRILKFSRSSYDIILVNFDFHIKITPYTMKLSSDIRRRMPSPFIIFADLGIPLAHTVTNSFQIIATGPADLKRDLGFKIHFQLCTFSGKNRLIQINYQDSTFLSKFYIFPILQKVLYLLITDLIRSQF